jgi:multidrug resistance protein MdtO
MTFQFLEFLRLELAPTPGRWQATLRLTLACIACTVPIMAFHLQSPLLVMVGMFVFAKEDTTTTLLGTILGIFGVAVGCSLLLVYYVSALDLPWLRVLGVPVFIACGLMINRIITIGPLGYGIAVPMALGMTVPDSVSSVEYINRYPFYLWSAWTLGLLVNLAVQYLMNPQKARSVLVRGLTTRLDAVEGLLRRLIAGEKPDSKPSAIAQFALMGVVEPLHQLKMSGAIEPWLKKNHAQVRAQFILVDRLVTAAAVLEFQGIGSTGESVKKRLQQVADACARWRTAIKDHRPPEIFTAAAESLSATSEQEALPSLAEMERAVELMPFTFPGRKLPEELKPAPNQDKGGALVPDAFTNPEYIQFAIKGALSGFICYLIFTLTSYPGIYNAVITSIVCSLATIGASLQKATLRFAGAAVGGALGLISLMYIFPHLDSLGGFWFPFGAATALAAYVNFGSPRIAYCGFQISLAFNKCVLQGYGPYTELRVVRDRLIGIVLGLVVFGFINNHLWPVKALDTTRAKLASILRALAKLAGLPDGNNHAPQMGEAYALRLQMYQDLGTLRQLFEGSKFEPGAPQRERLEVMDNTAQMLFLHQLAIIQHRPDLRPSAVPEQLRTASAKFRATLADLLLNLSDRMEGKSERPVPDLPSALAELEQAVTEQIKSVTDSNLVAQIRARLTLYQESVPIAMKLTRLQTA